jgi:hypothetical protein
MMAECRVTRHGHHPSSAWATRPSDTCSSGKLTEVDGSWRAWVLWVQESGGRPVHKVVSVRAAVLQPLDDPESYQSVPRRVRGRDGIIRPWSGESGG